MARPDTGDAHHSGGPKGTAEPASQHIRGVVLAEVNAAKTDGEREGDGNRDNPPGRYAAAESEPAEGGI